MYYVIPDIHGRYDLLDMALTKIYADNPNGGKIIFLGDYIDRGPENVKVLDAVMNPPEGWEFIALKGNHEDMFIGGYNRYNEYWDISAVNEIFGTGNGPMYVKWMDSLPTHHIEGQNVFVHAFYNVGLTPENQNPQMNMWQRMKDSESHGNPDIFVTHGHTPRENAPVFAFNRVNLDSGAVFYNRLIVGIYEDGKMGPQDIIEFK